MLASMVMDVHSEIPDQFGWLDRHRGVFTIKSSYELAYGSKAEEGWVGWMLIWRLRDGMEAYMALEGSVVREGFYVVTHTWEDPYKSVVMEVRNI